MEHIHKLSTSELSDLIAGAAAAFFDGGPYIPVFAWGDPGLGKTQAVLSAAERLGATVNVQHVADREPTEIGGIYWERHGEMVRLAPHDMPRTDGVPTILFMDELPQAPLMNKNAVARLVLDRRIGEHKLGDMVYVCAAGNYQHNRAGTSAMPSHLNARLTHVHIAPDLTAWRAWANRNNVHPYVVAYQQVAPQDHHIPNPDNLASPNPRSWVRVSDIEKLGLTGVAREAMIVGTLGVEVGEKYLQQARLFHEMPDPDIIIRSPMSAPIPRNRSALYALVSALSARATVSNIGSIIDYLMRLDGSEEYVALCLRDAKERCPGITGSMAFTKFAISPLGQSLV